MQQLVAQVPWGWSRDVLVHQVESGLHRRQGGAVTNFDQVLPPAESDLARQITKGPYKLGGARDAGSFTLDVQCKLGYSQYLIRTFYCKKTELLFNREVVKEFANIASAARRRLFTLNNARDPTDLLVPPGNRLEALQRDREGQHSVRINDQYRVCFTWKEDGPYDVEITKHYR